MAEDDGANTKAPAKRASPETVAEARRLFETTMMPGVAIGARLGLHGASVSRMAKTHGWRRPEDAEARRTLVGSLRRKVDREIVAAERALKAGGDAGAAARTLASLVRTLRELARYDEDRARAAGPGRGAARDDEGEHDFVADPDALREALAERLESLRRERGA